MLLRTWRRVVPQWGQVSAAVQHQVRCPHFAPLTQQPTHASSMTVRCLSSEPGGVAVQAAASPPPKAHKLRPITKDDVELSFARSSGAGGQNVNKVNTKVDMRFDIDKQDWIPAEIKEEIKRAEKNRFTKEGILVVTSQKHRTQLQNIDEALNRLQEILDAAVLALTPKEINPETVKKVKASIKAGHEKRLDTKKRDSMKKKERSRRDWD